MALSNYQMTYRGLIMGPGLPIHAMEIRGLEDFAVRSGDTELSRSDGDVAGLHTIAGKEVTLDIAVTGEKGSAELAATLAAVMAAFTPSDTSYPFVFQEPHAAERYVSARVIARGELKSPRSTHGFHTLAVRLKAADPFIYGTTSHQGSLTPYTTGGGADYPIVDYLKDWTVSVSGEAVAVNAGNAKAWPLIRFYGPTDGGTLTSMTLTEVYSGRSVEVVETVLAGQILTMDMKRLMRADSGDVPYVRLDDANRYGKWSVPREPFYLAPSPEANLLRYSITGTTSATLAVVTWEDTYI